MMAGKFVILVVLALIYSVQASFAGVIAPFATTYNAHSIQHAVAYPAAQAVSTVHVPLAVAAPSKVTFSVPAIASAPAVVVNAPVQVPFGAAPAAIDAPPKIVFSPPAFASPVSFADPAYAAFAASNYGVATAPLAFGLHPGGLATHPVPGTPSVATPAPVNPALATPSFPASPVAAPTKVPLSSSIFTTPTKAPTTFAAHSAPYFILH